MFVVLFAGILFFSSISDVHIWCGSQQFSCFDAAKRLDAISDTDGMVSVEPLYVKYDDADSVCYETRHHEVYCVMLECGENLQKHCECSETAPSWWQGNVDKYNWLEALLFYAVHFYIEIHWITFTSAVASCDFYRLRGIHYHNLDFMPVNSKNVGLRGWDLVDETPGPSTVI